MTGIVNSPVNRQIEIISQLRKDVDSLQAALRTNQLNYSALHNTALPIYGVDSAGNTDLRARLGKQPDGNYTIQYVNGDAPPMPDNIGVAERQLGILITWDGTFTGNAPKPSNFGRLDIYISTVDGFTPTIDTLMGSLYGEGAVSINTDTTTQYVRVIAVSNADVPSSATAQVAVTPLPAGQLAAGSVNAINLAAEIVLATRIVIGDIGGGRLVFDSLTGLELYKPDGTTRSVHLDPDTGNATLTGVLKTANAGSRIEVNPAATNSKIIRFFPTDNDTRYAQLVVDTVSIAGLNYALVFMNASAANAQNETGYVSAQPASANISWQSPTQAPRTIITCAQYSATVRGPVVDLQCSNEYPANPPNNAPRRVSIHHLDTSGNILPNIVIEWAGNNNAVGYWKAPAKDSGLVFEIQGLHATRADGLTHCPIYASAFTVLSGKETKVNIGDVSLDLAKTIADAPARMWEREGEKNMDGSKVRRKYIGPVAEDLPPQLQRDMGNGVLGVDLLSMVGILWNQVGVLNKKVDLLTDNLSKLANRDRSHDKGQGQEQGPIN